MRSQGFPTRQGRSRQPRLRRGRLLLALVVVAITLIGYYSKREYNPVTDEVQHISLSPSQEIALGLEAAPRMAAQHGGLHPDAAARALVERTGQRLVQSSAARDTPWSFEFHLLADPRTINAFALPGGQVFITAGLLARLETEGQLAGVLGHEIGHVVARHGAEQIAKTQLTEGLTGAAVIATYDPSNPSSQQAAAMAAMVGQLVNMKFGRDDELESDHLGVRFMSEAGYDPRALLAVMEILAEASGGARQPEFFSTHPNPEHREQRILDAIAERFPEDVPPHLEP